MSIEINMKMPKNCATCPMEDSYKEGKKNVNYCTVNEKKILNENRRSDSCPLKDKK